MLTQLQQIVQQVNASANLQEALGVIVHRVKAAMGADVCSVYVRDPAAPKYVLMATEGLNPAAVGQVRLAAGEGIVGLVATRQEPINLANAALHPSYRYFPESGEQQFSGFLAVPLVNFRQSMGVLVVQQRTPRLFAEEEVAFLMTIGAQLAGSLSHAAQGSAMSPAQPYTGGASGLIQGLSGAPGVTIGTIVLPSPLAELDAVADRAPRDIAQEEAGFRQAVRETQQELRSQRRSHGGAALRRDPRAVRRVHTDPRAG